MTSAASVEGYLARRRDNFLLLRILAAIAVIYGHSFALAVADGSQDIFLASGWGVYSGEIAVDVFFVISGFMVSGSYMARHDLGDYLRARLLRIVPAFLVVLVLSAFVLGPLLTSLPVSRYLADPATSGYVLKNLQFTSDMAWNLPGVFETHRMPSMNGSLWTLPAEMRMYLLVAVLGALGMLGARWLGTFVVLALLAAGLARPSLFALHQDWFRLAGFFCLGILVQLNRGTLQVRHSAMLVLAFLTYISAHTESYRFLLACSIAYFCFWFAYRTPYWAWLQRWGDPSYGIYLWGWPMQQLVIAAIPSCPPWLNFLLASAGAIVLGYLSWHVVEQPALRLKSFSWRRKAAMPLASKP